MAENDTLPPDGTQTDDGSGAPDPAAAGSGAGSEDVSLLKSRYAGQTAKVGELTGKLTTAEARAAAAEQKLADYEAGKLGADEALKAQLEAERNKTAAAEAATRAARIEAKFPETFAELGEDGIAGLSDEKLAALEARLKGEANEEPPTPGRHNESRTSAASTSKPREETADDIEARLFAMPDPYAR